VALIAIALLVRAATGIQSFAVSLLDPSVALTVLVLVFVIGVWRLLAIVDASASINRRTVFRGRPGQVLAILAALVLASHGVVAYYAWSFYDAGSRIFVGDGPDTTPAPSSSIQPTDELIATPFATPETEADRVTILLTGIDKTAQRSHSLTDTMLVVSVNPTSGEVAMISFPRDIAQFPLYSGGTFGGKINSLYSYARNHPDEFPDGPLPTLASELGFLLGIPIHYYAAVDIDGFMKMIDEVGGVTVTVERAIRDFRYDWLDGSPRWEERARLRPLATGCRRQRLHPRSAPAAAPSGPRGEAHGPDDGAANPGAPRRCRGHDPDEFSAGADR
jgi:polyisoprenyl-teichoic acid--peptidoglycan teichoic acid transferase